MQKDKIKAAIDAATHARFTSVRYSPRLCPTVFRFA
jgi:hypothetical protein